MDSTRGGWESCLACKIPGTNHTINNGDSDLPLSELFHGHYNSADELNLA